LEALISSNNKVWGEFIMHPIKTNMRLPTAAAAQACGGLLSQEEEEQLWYTDMLIDVSNNRNSPWCQVIEHEDENVSKLGLPFIQYQLMSLTYRICFISLPICLFFPLFSLV